MNNNLAPLLTALGFIALAFFFAWSSWKKQQMKHELTLKLLEKGKDMDQELLAKLLAFDKPGVPIQQKSAAERHREGGGFIGFLFLVAGLIFAFIGMMRSEFSWPLVGLGAFSFAFGWLCWIGTGKEYAREKAEEKLSRD